MKPSKLDIAKHKGEVLDQIMTWKRQEVPKQMELMPLAQVKAFARITPPALDFIAALIATPGASLIAEVKRASPSKGMIAKEWDPELIAETYARSGAAAISCLTDGRFFQGKLDYLTTIKERLREIGKPIPVLRKDFLYHEYQVHEARMAGADAILLIVGVLGDNDLRTLRELAESLGMAALVEVHDEAPEQLMVRQSGELTRVAEGAFLPTSAPEVRIAGAILAPWLFDGTFREPSPFERAVATRLGYTLLRLDGGWGMAELGTARRGLPTIVARQSASPSALALVAPAPHWEHGIVEASASLARALDPHLVLYAGAMPKAHPLGYADERHGHVGPSVLQRIAELWLADGGHTIAVRAMLPDIAPEDLETVLSLGTELGGWHACQ